MPHKDAWEEPLQAQGAPSRGHEIGIARRPRGQRRALKMERGRRPNRKPVIGPQGHGKSLDLDFKCDGNILGDVKLENNWA